jgi:glutathionyl-hydroquinone reductase
MRIRKICSLYHLGWRFPTADETLPGENVTPDPFHPEVKHMQDLYFMVDPQYSGRYTVPVLWDKKTNTIVNNESSEIIRILNTEFNLLLPEKYASVDLYPADLRSEIDERNAWTYDNINNGV